MISYVSQKQAEAQLAKKEQNRREKKLAAKKQQSLNQQQQIAAKAQSSSSANPENQNVESELDSKKRPATCRLDV